MALGANVVELREHIGGRAGIDLRGIDIEGLVANLSFVPFFRQITRLLVWVMTRCARRGVRHFVDRVLGQIDDLSVVERAGINSEFGCLRTKQTAMAREASRRSSRGIRAGQTGFDGAVDDL